MGPIEEPRGLQRPIVPDCAHVGREIRFRYERRPREEAQNPARRGVTRLEIISDRCERCGKP